MTSHLSLVSAILRPFPQLWPYYNNTTEFIKNFLKVTVNPKSDR